MMSSLSLPINNLPHADAILAKQREYDEPYLLQGPQALIEEVCTQIVTRGLRWTKGGRLFHLMGDNDKGEALPCSYAATIDNNASGDKLN